MKSRPRILYVSSCWPHGRAYGGQLRALHVGRALRQFGDVTLAVVSPDEPGEDAIRRTAAEFQLDAPVGIQECPNRGLIQRSRWAFDPRFLNVHGCMAHAQGRFRLLSRLNDFDLVWVLNSRTPNILQQWRWPNSVLDIDDVPSTFQRSIWQNGAGLGEKIKARALMLLLNRRERLWQDRFTALAVCSDADRQYLGGGGHIHVIPNGFERPGPVPPCNPVAPARIGFIGLYSYLPNLEGIRWFVRECWSQIKREVPDARLRLVGKDTDGPDKPAAPDVDALGWVADPASEIATWSAMIVPLRHGAGTRIKIAEAFSRKCPVVSTRLGAFGYDVQDGNELLLADNPNEFAGACVNLIQKPAQGAALAGRAWQKFLDNWSWDAIAPKVWAAAEDCLRRGTGRKQQSFNE
jgi:glycosyltransferase involved in cell wall biosynthesis